MRFAYAGAVRQKALERCQPEWRGRGNEIAEDLARFVAPDVGAPDNPEPVGGLRVAVIGGTAGLGMEAAGSLRRAGCRVFSGGRSTGLDVRDSATIDAFLGNSADAAGGLDVVINFAGVLYSGELVSMPSVHAEEVVDVNLKGSVNVARSSFPYLKESRGHLVFVSSSSYFRGRAGTAVYSASKAGVVNLTQALAEEWAGADVLVSCIVPRRANTEMRRRAFGDEDPASLLSPATVAEEVNLLIRKRQSGVVRHVY
jgi:NAD(P)-dependent dehydrogenase (short-subunit alcohol dehydrogenase family)